MSKYDDIIDLPHHISNKHPRMSRQARAAQFAPFAALTGYDACVTEAARLTDFKKELSEEEIFALNEKLLKLCDKISERPFVKITYFIRDKYKSGGRYEEIYGKMRIINLAFRTLELEGKIVINLDDICDIEEIRN